MDIWMDGWTDGYIYIDERVDGWLMKTAWCQHVYITPVHRCAAEHGMVRVLALARHGYTARTYRCPVNESINNRGVQSVSMRGGGKKKARRLVLEPSFTVKRDRRAAVQY